MCRAIERDQARRKAGRRRCPCGSMAGRDRADGAGARGRVRRAGHLGRRGWLGSPRHERRGRGVADRQRHGRGAEHRRPGRLLVGGSFTDAGGNAAADRIASWNGVSWSAVGSASDQIAFPGSVNAIAYANGKIYVGGTFLERGRRRRTPTISRSGTATAGSRSAPGRTTIRGRQRQGAADHRLDALRRRRVPEPAPASRAPTTCSRATSPPVPRARRCRRASSSTESCRPWTPAATAGCTPAAASTNVAQDPTADSVAYLLGGQWHGLGSAQTCICDAHRRLRPQPRHERHRRLRRCRRHEHRRAARRPTTSCAGTARRSRGARSAPAAPAARTAGFRSRATSTG